ncbi:uncharacterized protein LOC134871071 [Eleginops maclovinus]|uniref:uncharacterized protein LOC134871071 n=1 Tax=Eleginops maclovinus TaxID=56733 RepID=UPI0030808BCE
MSDAHNTPPVSQMEVRSKCGSAKTSASHRSSKSSASMAAVRARAVAEAARAKAEFAKRQIDMEVEKARIEARLNALKQEGEAEAALAAARVLEAAAEGPDDRELTTPAIPVTTHDPVKRVAEYIKTHFKDEPEPEMEERPQRESQPRYSVPPPVTQYTPGWATGTPAGWHPHRAPPVFNIGTRTDNTHSQSRSMSRTTEFSDLATYLARRDLLTTGFKVFDNKPETYLSWKSMFCNGIEGLNLKASEELNLLTKWLDGESLQHALRIRAVHVNNPETGLWRLWQRLDKNYGSSEAIEASLFKRLESFPRIFYKDNHLLQELADLLLELQAAKNEGYLPGLSFLDTSRGINPIVEKLPNNLQEAWIKQGSRYKKEHNALFPPFSYFVEKSTREADKG